jgi:hypothetical protein
MSVLPMLISRLICAWGDWTFLPISNASGDRRTNQDRSEKAEHILTSNSGFRGTNRIDRKYPKLH